MPEYIEGKRPIIEALRSGMPLKTILVSDNLKKDGLLEDLLRKAKRAQVAVSYVPRKKIDGLAKTAASQGVIAEAQPFSYTSLNSIIDAADAYAASHEGRALVVVLDHITDAGNLGAIVRSAESVGASGVVIPNKRSAQVTAATYKSSAGAIAHVPVTQVPNISQALHHLAEVGFWSAAASEHADQLIWDTNLRGKIALVMGNESEGVSRLVLESCDFLMALPQEGRVSSLNVAQASTACMYEWLRQNLR